MERASLSLTGWIAAALLSFGLAPSVLAQPLPEAVIGIVPGGVEAAALEVVSSTALTADRLVHPPGYLEIYSRGYARFEIEGQHIVAYYSGGVQFRYLGYVLRADELRFNQELRQAEVTGDVRLSSTELELAASFIRLDGLAGTGEANGRVLGSLPQLGAGFVAERVALSFPPGQDVPALKQARLELHQLTLYDSAGRRLTAPLLTFVGADRSIYASPVTLTGSIPNPLTALAGAQPSEPTVEAESTPGSEPTEPSIPAELAARISAHALAGRLSNSGELAELKLADVRLSTAPAQLTAGMAEATAVEGGWRLALHGPIVANLRRGEELLVAEAASAAVTLDSAGIVAGSLSDARVLADGNRFAVGSVSLQRVGTRLAIGAGGGVRLGLNLAQLLGVEPIDAAELLPDRE